MPARIGRSPMLYLVNLDDADERRASMQAQLDARGLAYRRVGVDFRRRDAADVARWVEANLPGFTFTASLSGAEIGCWASHLAAWLALDASPRVSACTVIEDDIVLGPAFAEATAALCERPLFDIVFLGTSCRNVSSRRRTPFGRFGLHQPLGTIYNTWGYVVSRDWVRGFLAARPWRIDRPIDHYTGGRRAGARMPRRAVLQPAVLGEHPALGPVSQIQPFTCRIDRARVVEQARRRLLASRVSELYYRLYRYL